MDFLEALGIKPINAGACSGHSHWLINDKAPCVISYNPANEQEIARVTTCDKLQYEKIISHAHASFLQWRQVPAPKRGDLIGTLAACLREHKENLGSLVALEMGKSKREGLGEVQEMIDMADFAVGQSRMLYGLTMQSERLQHRMYEQWHPLGVIGVITSFNFPVAVWAWNAFIAAICGNTIVWKPSAKTPLCAIAVQNICNLVMQDSGVEGIFSLIIPNDHTLSEQFVDDIRLPLISFTGSTATGRHIAERVSRRLGRSLLELGGNNAIIVDETADLDIAIPAIIFGAVGTAGQRCTSTRRVFIEKNCFDKVLSRLIKAYQQMTIGDPLDEKNLMGPLIDVHAVANFTKAIQEIQNTGGEIILGGKLLNQAGFYVEPTLVKASPTMPILKRETFAPILYLIPYHNLSDAIQMQNDVPQGLSSALFTNSLQASEYFLSAMGSDCGIANINIGTSGAEIGGAFGGEKETGGGREAGSDAWKAYMRRQTCTINWGKQLPFAQGIKFEVAK